ncbi:MAG: hypothetical protein H6621_11735 [Halobacteriovoraceae bacterium]|nr:hypothetical protein [Halobacteriovoraceae bacterium]
MKHQKGQTMVEYLLLLLLIAGLSSFAFRQIRQHFLDENSSLSSVFSPFRGLEESNNYRNFRIYR